MKEYPILFSAPMVRAILEGRKTQTRRVVKHKFDPEASIRFCPNGLVDDQTPTWVADEGEEDIFGDSCVNPIICPYGQPGDRLWVREAWCPGVPAVRLPGSGGLYGIVPHPKQWSIPKTKPGGIVVKYSASWNDGDHDGVSVPPMRPSIHMPRWASRITLEVTDVRVQRIQRISDEDCWAEGISEELVNRAEHFAIGGSQIQGGSPERFAFSDLWDSINAARGLGWDSNPWVWAISFRRIKP